jgi:oligopeptide transport system substrate-binding protein
MNVVCRFVLLVLVVGVVLWFHQLRSGRPSRVELATSRGILLVGNGTEPQTLDFQIATGKPEHNIVAALFEGLVAEHPVDDYANLPGVAESWESGDFVTWTFRLRQEARWSNGAPVTAHDFVYAYRRILSPRLGGDYAQMLYLMEGAEAYHHGDIDDFGEVGVRAIGDHLLEIRLVGPAPYFPSLLKHYTWFPVHPPTIEAHGDPMDRANRWTRPGNMVGNGPFVLRDWKFDHVIEVEKNELYWDRERVGLEAIHFFPIASDTTEERAFRDGQLHVTNTLPIDRIAHYREDRPAVYRSGPQLATYFYRVNTRALPELAEARVRQALSLAIDRRAIVEHVTRGGQRAAFGMVPQGGGEAPYQTPQMLRFDPQEAQSRMAAAGFPGGVGFPKLTLLFNTSEGHRLVAQAVQEMWKKHLGIEIDLLNQDWKVYLERSSKGDYQVCRAGWIGDYMDPSTFLNMWMSGDGNNQTGWSSPDYDDLLRRAARTADPAARFALLERAERILLEELPAIPVYWYAGNRAVALEVKNWHHKLTDNRPWKALWLASRQTR